MNINQARRILSITAEEDRLYFCLIPLLKKKMTSVWMKVKNGKVQLDFHLEKNAETYRIPN